MNYLQLRLRYKKLIRNIQFFFNKLIGHIVKDIFKPFKEVGAANLSPADFLQYLNSYCQKNFEYKYDGKIDFAMHPQYFAWRCAGDCDDWALYCLSIIREIKPDYEANILMVFREGEGHAVCIIKLKNGLLFHIGNWGLCGPFNDMDEVFTSIFTDWKRWYILDYNFNIVQQKENS